MPTRPAIHRPHQQAAGAKRHEPYAQRAKTSERGYGWNWQRLRKAHAASVPAICVQCGRAGPSKEMHLDHRTAKAKGGTDDASNLQWLCESCHSKKTVREDGGFGNVVQINASA